MLVASRSSSRPVLALALSAGRRAAHSAAASSAPILATSLASSTAPGPCALTELQWRGLLHAHTSSFEGLAATLRSPNRACLYAGFDPTADSLHAGNLLVLMGMLHFHRAGHQVIALVGGATGQVGDPSGRQTERSMLAVNTVASNAAGSPTSSPKPVTVVNNLDWYAPMNVLEFVRDVGQHFRMTTMLGKESVKSRLQPQSTSASGTEPAGMSFTEFTYQLFQAYDYYQLHERNQCRLQLGGSDQWGNITAGCDLIRKVTGKEAHGVTMPLVTTSTGEKFGKSMGNAVWMDAAKTTPFEWYQFFLRSEDSQAERYLRYYTFLSLDEITDIARRHAEAPNKRIAQTALADQVTLLVHGREGLAEAHRSTKLLYHRGGSGSGSPNSTNSNEVQATDSSNSPFELTSAEVAALLSAQTPSINVSRSELGQLLLIDALVRLGLTPSKSEAKKLIRNGGVSVNSVKSVNERDVLGENHALKDSNATLLRVGKRAHGLVLWEAAAI
ncbi:tyrosyl-tRNA synthetase [Capsaspora owczarzaki ATCC 30864]|uniref:Tyrosine--tRNA ligase n=1 Tax=Capsaspora owczarzaki (strain ATCC 30864) TaxID=595528 RepID=A0A0D2WVQ6_CAPO3|nr:tyrosyl-tRNA synthetase [Capsaspora owczarzaki ATCC 30864]KJE96358.1 tyrosyl-tRNA synthetase [Capsaspora owczarzaki ATCC 30864]|eukprot:XP_004344317.1 tyrosyl-tRNA synthetase [Capsaspora owczarzaki ATCC 30864]